MRHTPPALGDEPTAGFALPLLHNIVYCSRAAAAVDEAAVDAIIAVAQRWNPAHGVTGLLVFGSGIFFQWLEGPREPVTALMTRLQRDTRHTDIVKLSESEEVRERLFPDWAMQRVGAEDIRDVLLDALGAAEDSHNAVTLSRLLDQLDRGDLRDLRDLPDLPDLPAPPGQDRG